MPKRIRAHQLEDLSRSRLHKAFEEVGWTVEDLAKDYGEDLLVRIFDSGRTTPLSFFVQVKATDRIGRYARKDAGSIHFPVKTCHVIHWRNFHQPVIVTLWDTQSDKIYWNSIQRIFPKTDSISHLRKTKSVCIPIPRGNLINATGLKNIRKIACSQHARLKRKVEGLALLIDVLQSRFKTEIGYSSDGIICIGYSEFIFFGELRKRLAKAAADCNISFSRAFELALDNLFREFDEWNRTGKFPVRNGDTGKIEYKPMSNRQLRKYFAESIADLS